MKTETKTWEVVSYCRLDDSITEDHWITEGTCDSYIEYTIQEGDPLSENIWSVYENVAIGNTVLIHLDW